MSNENNCPICGQGEVSLQHFVSTLEYRGQTEQVQTAIKCCNHCESEFADTSISRQNKRATVAFHKRVDGLLSGAQIRSGRKRLGLNQKQAAQLFGGGPVAFSKYENDDVAQSAAMDKLLRLAFGDDHVFQRLLEQLERSGLDIGPTVYSGGSSNVAGASTTHAEFHGGEVIHVDFPAGARLQPAVARENYPVPASEVSVDERKWN